MPDTVSDLARRLAENAEAVCRHYLSNGRREGRYWLAGDVRNTPGRSLYVRLRGPAAGRGAAGKWTDAATGEHGDLLDLIGAAQGARTTGEKLDEARRFLGVVRSEPEPPSPVPSGSLGAARRLFAMSKPIAGTLVETYLRVRGIVDTSGATALRFHPHCFYRADPGTLRGHFTGLRPRNLGPLRPDSTRDAWPALVAAVTDVVGSIMGVQRTWLDPSGRSKAPVGSPRRAMGHLLGHAVRLGSSGNGAVCDVMAAGEGIETVLSLRSTLPCLPMAAALSAGHLASLLPFPGLRRLYIVRDNDRAGHWAADKLAARMQEAGVETLVLAPTLGDWNDDLRQLGPDAVASAVRGQLAPEDVDRFWRPSEQGRRTR